MKIKALWIDDRAEEEDSLQFRGLMNKEGIEIVPARSVEAGMRLLDDKKKYCFDAIILDINCYIENGANARVTDAALGTAMLEIVRRGHAAPVFVYSGLGSDSISHFMNSAPQLANWHPRKIFQKGIEEEDLIEAIRTGVEHFEDFGIKKAHADAFGVVADHDLIEMIKASQSPGFHSDSEFLMLCRKRMEEVVHLMQKKDLVNLEMVCKTLRNGVKSSNHVKICSEFLDLEDRRREFVPSHIKRLFYFFSSVANECAHAHGDTANEPAEFKTPNLLENGKAPFLNHTALYGLLTILAWVRQLPVADDTWLKSWQDHFAKLLSQKRHGSAPV